LQARKFRGGVVDTGAPYSVIGQIEARLYCQELDIPFSPAKPSNRRFRFGTSVYSSIGQLRVMLPTSTNPLSFVVDIISLDIPLLVGKSTLEQHDLAVDVKRKQLNSPTGSIPLHDYGHLIIKWNSSDIRTHYTKGQIRKLHRHYLHPSTTKLYDLLRRADPNLSSETKGLIQNITQACSTCAEYSTKPICFSVRTPDDVVFNQKLLLDIMYINTRPILTIVDRGTRFLAARFIPPGRYCYYLADLCQLLVIALRRIP
jgi:hypothetical protein